ncbi:MAG: ABC transporter permease subunit [Verrucomicrobia bacterium]|nr:ABC transporter permease subunit [Verrucomicrobiota bacterium]
MTFLPIVERELRAGARRSKTYWLRLAAAVAALVICAWIALFSVRTQAPITVGKTLFTYLSVFAFSYCLLVGAFITADCLSEEKRDGTLGLLFLTELRSFDVLLGKWIATSLAGLYGLMAVLPALGLPLLLGGVTPGEYGRTAVAVMNAIFFSLAVGMFTSVLSRDQGKATLAAVALTLGVAGLLPGLAAVVESRFFTVPLAGTPWLALASPAYSGWLATDTAFRGNPQGFWWSVGAVQGLSWLALIATAILLPRVWREDPAEKPVARRWIARFGYTRGWRRTFRRRLDRNPVLAVAARHRWPHFVFWSLVTLVTLNVSWFVFGYRAGGAGTAEFHRNFSLALVLTNRVWAAVLACHFILEARRSGALELILTTPLPVKTLLRGHWQAIRRYFFLPVLVIGLLHVFYVVGQVYLPRPGFVAPPTGLTGYAMANAAGSFFSYVTDVLALCVVGAWFSLSVRRTAFAIFYTFGLVILLPWACAYFLPGLAQIVAMLPPEVAGKFWSHPWVQKFYSGSLLAHALTRPVLTVLKNLLLAWWAGALLRRHFRAAAAGTLERRRWFGRFRQPLGQPVAVPPGTPGPVASRP